jgi:hypothetical protein
MKAIACKHLKCQYLITLTIIVLFLSLSVNAQSPPQVGVCETSYLSFDGSNDLLEFTSSPIDGAAGTWEAWVKRDHWINDNGVLFGNDIPFNTDNTMYASFHSGVGLHFRYGSTQNEPASGSAIYNNFTGGFAPGSWHHLAFSWEHVGGTTTLKMFVDGIEQTSFAVNANPINNKLVAPGMIEIGHGADGYFNGTMSEVRTWSVARTEAEIQGAMNSILTGNETGLMGYWRLDEGSGSSTAVNQVTGGSDATLTNFDVNTAWESATVDLEISESGSLVASGGSSDFGNTQVNGSGIMTFTLTNHTFQTITYANVPVVSAAGTDASSFTVDESLLGTTLAAGAQAGFDVTFSPTSLGSYSANLTIESDDACGNATYVINLTGEGANLPVIDMHHRLLHHSGQTTVADLDATDGNGGGADENVTYSITGGAESDDHLFQIDAATGELSFLVAPDVASPADFDADNEYDLTIIATNGVGDTEIDLAVRVVEFSNHTFPVTSSPEVIAGVSADYTAVGGVFDHRGFGWGHNGTATVSFDAPVDVQSIDVGAGVQYTVDPVDGTGIQVTLGDPADFNIPLNYTQVTGLTITQSGGFQSPSLAEIYFSFSLPIFSSDDYVTFDENDTQQVLDVEAIASGSGSPDIGIDYSLSTDLDGALFAIDGSGILSFLVSPNFESPQDLDADNIYEVIVKASDNGVNAYQLLLIEVVDINDPPALDPVGDHSINVGRTLEFSAVFVDEDVSQSPTIILDATSLGKGMTIQSNGDFAWAPLLASVGTHSVEITVDDGASAGNSTVTETINITVYDPNEFPVLASIGNQNVNELVELTFTASATDADDPEQQLTYSLDATSISKGMTLDGATGAFTWTPSEMQDGQHLVTVTVTDDGPGLLADEETFDIMVNEINEAPVFTTAPTTWNFSEDGYTARAFLIEDPDGQDVTVTLDETSESLGFQVATVNGNPAASHNIGSTIPLELSFESYTMTVSASDGVGGLTEYQIPITIEEHNQAPVLTAIDDKVAYYPDEITFTAQVQDADLPADNLVFSLDATSLAKGMTIDASTGEFSWTPTLSYNGNHLVEVIVEDDGEPVLSDQKAFDIDVYIYPSIYTRGAYELADWESAEHSIPGNDFLMIEAAEKLFTVEFANGLIHEYDMSAGDALERAVFVQSVTPLDQVGESFFPFAIDFAQDGLKMFIMAMENGGSSFAIYSYDLTVAYDLSSLVSLNGTLERTLNDKRNFQFAKDGMTYYEVGQNVEGIFEYSLSSAYDLSTATLLAHYPTSGSLDLYDFEFSNDGKVISFFFNSATSHVLIGYYELSIPYELTGEELDDVDEIGIGLTWNNQSGFDFNVSGTRLYMVGEEYAVADKFVESADNAGVVEGEARIVLQADSFVNPNGTLTQGVDYTFENLPNGLTPNLAVSHNGSYVIMTLTGSATSHEANHSVDDLIISFTNSAFSIADAADIANAISYHTGILIEFDDNEAPVLAPIGDKNMDELATLTFTASSTDTGGPLNELTYSLDQTSLDLGMTLDPSTGEFSWTPEEVENGIHQVTVTVTDNGVANLSDTEVIEISVEEVNQAPVLDLIGDKVVDEEMVLDFTVTALDDDLPANTLTYSLDAASLSLGMTIDDLTGEFSWLPSETQDGVHSVTITVTDDEEGNLADFETFTIAVNDVNQAPYFSFDVQDITINLPANEDLIIDLPLLLDDDVPVQKLTNTTFEGLPVGMSSSESQLTWPQESIQAFSGNIVIEGADIEIGGSTIQETVTQTFSLVVQKSDQILADLVLEQGGEVTELTYGAGLAYVSITNSSGLIPEAVITTESDHVVGSVQQNSNTFTFPITIVEAGAFELRIANEGDQNYNAVAKNYTIVVDKADQEVMFDPINAKTYGDADFDVSVTNNTGLALSYSSSDETVADIVDGTITIYKSGTTNISVFNQGDDNYHPFSGIQELVVNKINLTITADAKSKTYGADDPTLTYEITGGALVGDDALTGALTREDGDDVGSYTIGQGTLEAGNNYSMSLIESELVIDPLALTITADAVSKTYGADDPTLTYEITSGALVGDDALTGALTREDGDDVGSYAIGQGTLDASDNYEIIYQSSSLTITKATLIVKADPQIRKYKTDNPSLTISYGGFVGVDMEAVLDSLPTASTTATKDSDVGEYPIIVGGGADLNYDFDYQDGVLTVEKADQVIDFSSINNTDLNHSNEINLEASASSGLDVSFELMQGAGSIDNNVLTLLDTGRFEVVAIQSGDTNYHAASSVSRVFDVSDSRETKESQTISFEAIDDQMYGNLVDLQSSASSGLAITYELVQGNGIIDDGLLTIFGVGQYLVRATQEGNEIYHDASPIEQSFVASKAPLTFEVDDVMIKTGEDLPMLSYSIQGFVHDDTEADLDSLPIISTMATSSSDQGTYPIILTGGSDDHYEYVFMDGVLTVGSVLSAEINQEKPSVYPTPAQDVVEVELSWDSGWIRIFDLRGIELKSQVIQNEKTRLDTSDLPEGLYILHITDREENGFSMRLLIRR